MKRNTPGCARCQCSKADPVTTFNIFRIVAYGATEPDPCTARLSAILALDAPGLSASALRGHMRGGCDIAASKRGGASPFAAGGLGQCHQPLDIQAGDEQLCHFYEADDLEAGDATRQWGREVQDWSAKDWSYTGGGAMGTCSQVVMRPVNSHWDLRGGALHVTICSGPQ